MGVLGRVRTQLYRVYLLGKYPTEAFGMVRYGLNIHPTEHSGKVRYGLDTGTRHFGTFGTPTEYTPGIDIYPITNIPFLNCTS